MTLGRAYELGLLLATTVGLLAVLLGGELPPYTWLCLAAPPFAIFSKLRVPTHVGTAIGGAGVVAIMYSAMVRGVEGLVLGGALFLIALLVGRLLTRTTLRHDLQALLMALLLVFVGTVLHTQITYGLVFIAFSIAMVWALVARQLVAGAEKEAERPGGAELHVTLARRDVVTPTFLGVTGGLSVVLLVAAAALFLLFPRVGMGALASLYRGRGILPEDVSLTGDPRAGLGGGEVVARVTGVSEAVFDRGLYLRGPVYEELRRDGFARATTDEGRGSLARQMAEVQDEGSYQVFMQPVAGETLFALGPVERAGVVAGGASNPSIRRRIMPVGLHPELRTFRPLTGPARIAVVGGITHGIPGRRRVAAMAKPLEFALDLPWGLDGRIPELARRTAGEGDLFTRVERLRQFLRSGFTYSLDQTNGDKPDPLVGFLFEDRRGHCEYFATAFAVMLRSVGIPARVVGGFQGGLWDDSADVAVFTTAHAHAWVEWYVPGHGWVTDDATPAALGGGDRLAGLAALWERLSRGWDDYVVEYSLVTQWELFSGTARTFGGHNLWRKIEWRRVGLWVAGVLAGLVLVWLVWLRWSHRARGVRELPLGRALRVALERLRAAPLPDTMTLREGVGEHGEHRQVLDPVLLEYELQRFAGHRAEPLRERRLIQSLRRLP